MIYIFFFLSGIAIGLLISFFCKSKNVGELRKYSSDGTDHLFLFLQKDIQFIEKRKKIELTVNFRK